MEETLNFDKNIEVLHKFLSFPINSSFEILEYFSKFENAISNINKDSYDSFVYVPGTKKDRVSLIAHCDTVWDREKNAKQKIEKQDNYFVGENQKYGIGADDRAGCAILDILKDLGHSLLILDGEEIGSKGAKNIVYNFPNLLEELNNHCFMIQLDRRNGDDYKCYDIPVTLEFIDFIESETRYNNAGNKASTDIRHLCKKICGVNLSVGYYNEHTCFETINILEWNNTLNILFNLLQKPQKQYLLKNND